MVGKYKIVPVEGTTDEFVLEYSKDGREQGIRFSRTIDVAKEIESVTAKARVKMYKELSEQGLTKNDFIVKKENKDGSVTYDETNYLELEKKYTEGMQVELVNTLIKKLFKMDIITFVKELDLTDPKQQAEFTTALGKILSGANDTPSDTTKEETKQDNI